MTLGKDQCQTADSAEVTIIKNFSIIVSFAILCQDVVVNLLHHTLLLSARIMAKSIASSSQLGVVGDESDDCQTGFLGPLDNNAKNWAKCGVKDFEEWLRERKEAESQK